LFDDTNSTYKMSVVGKHKNQTAVGSHMRSGFTAEHMWELIATLSMQQRVHTDKETRTFAPAYLENQYVSQYVGSDTSLQGGFISGPEHSSCWYRDHVFCSRLPFMSGTATTKEVQYL
jgi:hypothetical protein